MSTQEPKSCPFCGGKPKAEESPIYVAWAVICYECGIEMQGEDEAEAVERWNRRAAKPSREPDGWLCELRSAAGTFNRRVPRQGWWEHRRIAENEAAAWNEDGYVASVLPVYIGTPDGSASQGAADGPSGEKLRETLRAVYFDAAMQSDAARTQPGGESSNG